MEKPRALHPIEDAYFQQSHLKGKHDYGHQAVAVMLSSAQMCPYQRMRFCLITYADGRLKYFSASVRINWHWTAIKYVLHRESEDFGS